jgi:Cell wall-active antibiotics response 4TMS YvqF
VQQPPPSPQQAAIETLRERYTRGEITYETFRRGLDALMLAHSPEECDTVLQALPASPTASGMRALETNETVPSPPAAPAPTPGRTKWLVMLMGELKRTRRPWRLAENTLCFTLMGATKLDLSLATLPRSGSLRILAGMGEVTLYVPRSISVTIRAMTLLGETKALGEEAAGILAPVYTRTHDEDDPSAPQTHLEIDALMVMGSIKVIQVNRPAVRVREAPQPRPLPQPQ